MRKQNIDLLYDLVKEEYKSKPFNFNAVYKALIKDIKLSKKEQETEIGSLYTDLLQDKRFVYIGDKQ
jgi:DNA-directed RNA polymerase delta subunit